MNIISRRKFIGLLASFGTLMSLPGCNTLKHLLGLPPKDKPRGWKEQAKVFWKTRLKQRQAQRHDEREKGKRPDVDTPHPYLRTDVVNSTRGDLITQFNNIPLNQWSQIFFTIINQGNAPSWTCYVEAYEGPWVSYHVKYADMRRVSRIVTFVLPGQKKEVVLNWQTTQRIGSLTVVCYDPMLDQKPLTCEQFDRKSDGFSWRY